MKKIPLQAKLALGFLGLVLCGSLLAISLSISSLKVNQNGKFGTVNLISDRYYEDVFGTPVASGTLSGVYSVSTPLRILGLSNVVIGGTWTPRSYGSVLYLQIERSLDNGVTYVPYDTITPSTDRISVYNNGFVTSSVGIPFQVPGAGTSASGTTQTFSFDTTLAADYIRVGVKENTTSTAGTAYVQLLTTNH